MSIISNRNRYHDTFNAFHFGIAVDNCSIFSILLSSSGNPPKTIAVSSPNPGEGKTTTVMNTAIVLAQTGARVIIIDADMRKPRIHKVFGKENGVGLSSFLSGNADLESVVQKSKIPDL